MSQIEPEWRPELAPNYDAILLPAGAEELVRLGYSTPSEREAFMRDTREVHHRLYGKLVPPGFSEYAGTYRGTSETTLENRLVSALKLGNGHIRNFAAPETVEGYLAKLDALINDLVTSPQTSDPKVFFKLAARIFYLFGLVHPYLDGNGHVQRLLFAAAIYQCPELELLPTWTIHPRPYDQEMAMAFENEFPLQAVADLLSEYVK